MGGRGSGRYQSYSAHDLVEDTLTLNIFRLYRDGFIIPGAMHRGTFTCGKSSMDFTLANNRLRLVYNFSNGLTMDYIIRLAQTPCHFGGVRLWFLCPECGRRAGKLYLVEKYVCRLCANLTYQSTRELSKSKFWAHIQAVDRRIARLNQKYGQFRGQVTGQT